jgi:Domain of unknown function (DUF2703)
MHREDPMLQIDFLYLDLTTCTRCRGADRNLESALEVARDILTAAGTEVEVNKIHVESAAQARELGLVSSPTIRVNDRDIAHELRESSCGCEGCTDGCGESVDCRVWVHRGREHTEPPVELILDAILREVYGGSAVERARHPEPDELPENLERFFAGKAAAVPAATGCCSPAEQSACCEPEDKAECCGTATGTGCGCR